MKVLNKLTSLQLVRNMAQIEWNNMIQKWSDKKIDTKALSHFMNNVSNLEQAETNLSTYLNKN